MALQISNEKGYPYTCILSAVLLGWSLAMQGQMAEGIVLACQGLNAANETSLRLHYSQLSAMLAEILMAAGRHEEAIAGARRGHPPLRAVSRPVVCSGPVEAQRGRVACFERGLRRGRGMLPVRVLALALRLGAQVSALRGATRLAQLQHASGNAEAGRQALQEIHTGFSEGHDTPDLRERLTCSL